MEIVALDYLWWGVAIGGTHYTGEIVRKNAPRVELTRRLSLREAKALAHADDRMWLPPERETNRFNSLKQLERYAVRWCEQNLGPEWLLQEHNYFGPFRPIAGRGRIMEMFFYLKELAENWDKVPESRRVNSTIDAYWKAWENMVKHV